MKYLKSTMFYSLIIIFILGISILLGIKVGENKTPKHAKVYPELKTVASFKLNSGNSIITEELFKEHWTFVFFGFTYCPDVCPTTMSALKNMVERLPAEVQKQTQALLVSVDPERDSPELIEEYAKAFNPSFIGATSPDVDYLKAFALDFGAIFYKSGDLESQDYLVDHTAKVFLINPKGQRVAIFNKSMESPSEGYEYNIEQMVKDFKIIQSL